MLRLTNLLAMKEPELVSLSNAAVKHAKVSHQLLRSSIRISDALPF